MDHWSRLEADGFAIFPAVFAADECQQMAEAVFAALSSCADDSQSLRRVNGTIYGARNLLDIFPSAAELWRRPLLVETLRAVLGPRFGLARGLYFDKPPANTWSLPWHRDLTIAVRDHALLSTRFRNPTTKGGVKHVEAPDCVLQQMLTLRIHLDDVTAENGPLQIIPGTQFSRDTEAIRAPVAIHVLAGDVLAMRPLLMHSSGDSREGTARHRRVVHLEFAASPELPDGYQWRWFIPGLPAR
jgi:hypothetical protein